MCVGARLRCRAAGRGPWPAAVLHRAKCAAVLGRTTGVLPAVHSRGCRGGVLCRVKACNNVGKLVWHGTCVLATVSKPRGLCRRVLSRDAGRDAVARRVFARVYCGPSGARVGGVRRGKRNVVRGSITGNLETAYAVFKRPRASCSPGGRLAQFCAAVNYPGADMFDPLVLTYSGTTHDDLVALCWRRCSAAEALAIAHPSLAPTVARFIDSHFALIRHGTTAPSASFSYRLFPEKQTSLAETMYATWSPEVTRAISDIRCTSSSAVARVLQKGAPNVGSVRYIGAQLHRACHVLTTAPDHVLLRDILRCCALNTWGSRPAVSPQVRYRAWCETPAAQYARCAAYLKSADVQFCIADFIRGMSTMDIGVAYLLRHRRPFPNVLTMTALERAAGPGPSAWPRHGFGRCIDPTGKLFNELQPNAIGVPPSAKRVKAAYLRHKTPELTASVRAASHKAVSICAGPLTSIESAHQLATLRRVYALVCIECGTWRTRPRGGQKSGPAAGVLIDMDRSQVTCSGCGSASIYRVLVNGYQIGHRGLWGALCSQCGDFGTGLRQHGAFSYCPQCHASVAAQAISGVCACGATATTSHLASVGHRYVTVPTCAAHAAQALD